MQGFEGHLHLRREEGEEERREGSRRRSARLSRHLQLSPVKETIASPPTDLPEGPPEDTTTSSDSSSDCIPELPDLEADLAAMADKAAFISNFACIFQVEEERVLVYLHYRDGDPQVANPSNNS